MFTREDYREYFSAILEKEKGMISGITDIKSSIGDQDTFRVLDLIINDEVKHYSYTAGLLEMLNERVK